MQPSILDFFSSVGNDGKGSSSAAEPKPVSFPDPEPVPLRESKFPAVTDQPPPPPKKQRLDPSGNDPRCRYTYRQKWEHLKRADARGRAYVQAHFNIPPSVLSEWSSDRPRIEQYVLRGFGDYSAVQPLKKYKALFEEAHRMYLAARDLYAGVSMASVRSFCCSQSEDFRKLLPKKQYESLAVFKQHYGLSVRRVTGLTQLLPQNADARVAQFHLMLHNAYRESQPEQLILLDETAVWWNPSAATTLAPRGAKRVVIHADDEKKMSTALLWASCSVTSSGDIESPTFGKPLVIFKGTPGAKQSTSVENKAHRAVAGKDATVDVTANGWVTEEAFGSWLQSLPPTRGRRTWMIMDLYSAHRSQLVTTKLKLLGITPFYVPGGCTSVAQFHDVYVNRAFKSCITELYGHAARENPQFRVQREAIIDWVTEAQRRLDPELIIKGVRRLVLTEVVVGNMAPAADELPEERELSTVDEVEGALKALRMDEEDEEEALA